MILKCVDVDEHYRAVFTRPVALAFILQVNLQFKYVHLLESVVVLRAECLITIIILCSDTVIGTTTIRLINILKLVDNLSVLDFGQIERGIAEAYGAL